MSPSRLKPSETTSMVVEGDEMHASMLCNSSSTLERGLEGKLIDLWWKAIMLRRVTLLWTNLLNRSTAPASRSPMQHSNACNCSSLQITEFFFWNALEMRDNFGNTICFDKRSSVDSNREVVICLALLNSLTFLESSMSEATFFTVFLECFFAFFTSRMYDRILGSWLE
uniref:Uncharacterized protein n=1 Tax=Oryza rufipogon TaxID=4529 RepID=A0A0E0QM64_ORYRU